MIQSNALEFTKMDPSSYERILLSIITKLDGIAQEPSHFGFKGRGGKKQEKIKVIK